MVLPPLKMSPPAFRGAWPKLPVGPFFLAGRVGGEVLICGLHLLELALILLGLRATPATEGPQCRRVATRVILRRRRDSRYDALGCVPQLADGTHYVRRGVQVQPAWFY